MDITRRRVIKGAGAAGAALAAFAAGALKPSDALAITWDKSAFEAKSMVDALKALNMSSAAESKDIVIKAPDIAENGAVVPIDITSNIPDTQSISLFIEKNPFPYVGTFDFTKEAVPYVHVRVKVGQSSPVRVVVTAGGKHYQAMRDVKVTIGGCGG